MLTLNEEDFFTFFKQVRYKATQLYTNINECSKIIVLNTVSKDIQIILTPGELARLYKIMEEADSEIKAQELMYLFK